jgi:Zn-finger nucleic acid-binding protein
MFAKEYAYCSQIIIDVCPEGCGVWLDEGEIQELEKFFERTRKSVAGGDARQAKRGMWSSLVAVLKR